ncbi:site-2 protease family protein [Ruminococcus flavefaciens]|uniref:Peptidase M50 domain-containing protein n=1 Tax=Ruminococcus flavefaciens 007c TaxID=1341157 RepID=W7UKI5_RUMFL|nr:site-2 protease family protein [Ruminococcus flavefaciens]EWM54303.1 hypothetical protein RF007C_11885 [Ruminococcus flavefaciens 007c]
MIGTDFSVDFLMMLVARAATFLLVIPIHESAHGLMAKWLGDDTAQKAGRITLNPFAHLEPIGLIMMLVLGVGWAKPVPVDPSKFKHKRLGYALVSLAGPVSNLIAAFIGAAIVTVAACVGYHVGVEELTTDMLSDFANAVFTLLVDFVQINIVLALFNMIPLPPMDGFNFLRAFMPYSFDRWVFRNQRILTGIFFGIIMLSSYVWQVRVAFAVVEKLVEVVIWMSVSWIPLLFNIK